MRAMHGDHNSLPDAATEDDQSTPLPTWSTSNDRRPEARLAGLGDGRWSAPCRPDHEDALVVGSPAHRIAAFVRLQRGGLYFVASCGMTGETDMEPTVVLDHSDRCVMCFVEVVGEAA